MPLEMDKVELKSPSIRSGTSMNKRFRYNNRLPMSDADRFSYLVRKIVGKRLTYAQLTGKVEERPEETF